MKSFALFACLGLLVACGGEEAHDHDHGADKAPATKDVEKMADKAPPAGAEMKTVTLAIEGMS